jgi:radical SAM protein with 4Fe4S-binding SPASM domain
VLVVDTTKNNFNILATLDLTKYNSVPELYNELLPLKKDVYEECDRIVFLYGTSTKVLNLVKELLDFIDIPEFFVQYEQTNSTGGLDFEFSASHCIYPWANLVIDNLGDIGPCCLYKGKISNINNSELKEIYHSDRLQELRKQFLAGEYPSACSACWKSESVGIPSMRQGAKHKFREIYYKIDYEKEDFDNLQIFDLKIGNSCNLACKICSPAASSKIAEAAHKSGMISTIEFDQLKKSVKWADSTHFWEQMLTTVNNLKYLDLYGGEPLMSKIHFNFLRKLIDLDVAKNIKIDYNTNGTVYSEKFFDIWQHFKEVKLSFSIDDIEDRFEQQRFGASWTSVCENIKKYNTHKSNNFITEIFPTINTQNVFYIPELLEWATKQNFDHIYFNMLTHPIEYNITSLRPNEKHKVIEKLKQNNTHNVCSSIIALLENSIDVAKNHRQNAINKV